MAGLYAVLLIVVVAVVLVSLFRSAIVVHQAQVAILERLGKYHRTLDAGTHIVIPYINSVRAWVDMREQYFAVKPQAVITADNTPVTVDSILYFQVMDAKKFTYNVANGTGAVESIIQTAARAVIGTMTLDEVLSGRDKINAALQGALDRETDVWGVRANRIEIKDITPPQSVIEAMERQMKAERDKRATITQAEAQKQQMILDSEGQLQSIKNQAEAKRQAAILEAEGQRQSAILRAQGTAEAIRLEQEATAQGIRMINEAAAGQAALTLHALKTLERMADGQATKLVVPSDLAGLAGALAAGAGLWGATPPGKKSGGQA